jgi:hypothetical protein
MGPQVRMAGSLSINKRKTYAADARDVVAARRAKAREAPRTAVAVADGMASGPSRFCPMMALRTTVAAVWPKTQRREWTITSPIVFGGTGS